MAFKKGNKLSNGRPRGSLNKKTVIMQSLQKLNKIGISPLETSNKIINSLLDNSEITIDQKIKLLQAIAPLIKYETMDVNQLANLDEVLTENEELKSEVKDLKDKYLIADTTELLDMLKKEEK